MREPVTRHDRSNHHRQRGLGSVALIAIWCGLFAASLPAMAAVKPPADIQVTDLPNDAGKALTVEWTLSPDDRETASPRLVTGYRVERATVGDGKAALEFTLMSDGIAYGETRFVDKSGKPNEKYLYRVIAISADGADSVPVTASEPASPVMNWFDWRRGWFLAITAVVCGLILLCTVLARTGKPFYVRPIAGLQAIEEAVGRSTEMGRPILFVPGIVDMNEIETVAGLTIMSRVAETAAEYDTPMEVPTSRSLVMAAAREASAAAAIAAGRPDWHDPERIHYVTDEQFGYVASVCGWMQREEPAACFYLGKFYAESLLLAETGNAVGAIQVGGTAEASQLPFFVAACDYTLIGEELFAASAYLSGEPEQLGTLKGQDFGKLLAAVLLVLGCVLATISVVDPGGAASQAEAYLKMFILGKGEE
ncbi:MAG: fibronectin type III domain-containing protein [Planctomycetaceae bacterium]|nr:fibronectin type III domain-containing protein [Planctomycetaceae bacterium]